MTQEQQAPRKRVRINISTSVKGVKTWDCTVELIEDQPEAKDWRETSNDAIVESDWLVAELDKRYPAPEVG